MEIYIEKILIINILLHVLIVYTIRFLTNTKLKLKFFILSIFLGAIYLIISLIYPNKYNYFFFIIISYLPFLKVKESLLYLMFNYILGGVITSINLSINYYYEVIFISSLIISFIIFISKNTKEEFIDIVLIGEEEYKLKCFYDTGCKINLGLTPIIVVNKKLKIELQEFSSISVNTISSEEKHIVYKAKHVYLDKRKRIEKHCLIILADIEYDVICGDNFLGGL